MSLVFYIIYMNVLLLYMLPKIYRKGIFILNFSSENGLNETVHSCNIWIQKEKMGASSSIFSTRAQKRLKSSCSKSSAALTFFNHLISYVLITLRANGTLSEFHTPSHSEYTLIIRGFHSDIWKIAKTMAIGFLCVKQIHFSSPYIISRGKVTTQGSFQAVWKV